MDSEKPTQLFVYSSLRKGFHQGAYQYITQHFTPLGNAKVKGVLRDLGNQPVANPSNEEIFIKGELYALHNPGDFSWVFGQLDEYEGLITEAGEHPLYRREIVTVQKEDGSKTDAWIYWYNKDASNFPMIPSGDVIEYIQSKK